MAFTNEYLTKEETALIEQTKLDCLLDVDKSGGRVVCNVKKCTTDREKRIWFIHCVPGAGYDLQKKEEEFVLFYGDISIDNMIRISMEKLEEEKEPIILRKYNVDRIFYWAVKAVTIPPGSGTGQQEILSLLIDIMEAYGSHGEPGDKGVGNVEKIRVFLERKGI